MQLASNIAALFVVDKAGRKPLLILSAILMSLSMASMGTAFYLKQQHINSFGSVDFAHCALNKLKVCAHALTHAVLAPAHAHTRTRTVPNKYLVRHLHTIFQLAAAHKSHGLYDRLFHWLRMHSIFIARRAISSRASIGAQLDRWLLQFGRHVYRH